MQATTTIDLVKPAEALSAREVRSLIDVYWLFDEGCVVEQQIKHALDSWTDAIPAARWAKSINGIGPVLSAGLAAHIDPTRSKTASGVWRFAGLDPTVEWEPEAKRPWNASLKTLCWQIGEAFVKASGGKDDFYGKLYLRRKQVEQEKNEDLPPAQVHARAKRWAVKLFLAHYHHVAWRLATGEEPVKPYVISILGHADFIAPPNFPEAGGE